jgi:hypothetical protein
MSTSFAHKSTTLEAEGVTHADEQPRIQSRRGSAQAYRLKRRAPIVIGDTKLARPFERLLWAQELRWWFLPTLVAAVLTYTISKELGLKFDWRASRYGAGGVVLTPPPMPAEDW